MIRFFQNLQTENGTLVLDDDHDIEYPTSSRRSSGNSTRTPYIEKKKQSEELKRASALYKEQTRQIIETQRKKRTLQQSINHNHHPSKHTRSNNTYTSSCDPNSILNNNIPTYQPVERTNKIIKILMTRHYNDSILHDVLLPSYSQTYLHSYLQCCPNTDIKSKESRMNTPAASSEVFVDLYDNTTVENIKNFLKWNHSVFMATSSFTDKTNNFNVIHNNQIPNDAHQDNNKSLSTPSPVEIVIDLYIPDPVTKKLWRIDKELSTLSQLIEWCHGKDISTFSRSSDPTMIAAASLSIVYCSRINKK